MPRSAPADTPVPAYSCKVCFEYLPHYCAATVTISRVTIQDRDPRARRLIARRAKQEVRLAQELTASRERSTGKKVEPHG